jgi:lactoylglutathione lyase
MTGMAKIEMTLGWVIAYVDDPPRRPRSTSAPSRCARTSSSRASTPRWTPGPTKLGFAAYALARGNFDGGVRPAGSDGPPPNVEIALVAEDVDAAYQTAVDAGCEPLAAPADKPQGQRVGYVRDPFGMLVELATPL